MKRVLYPLTLLIGFIFLMTATSIDTDAASWVSTKNDLVTALTKTADDEVILSNDIYLDQRIDVVGNKELNLNGKNLMLGTGASDSGNVGKFYLNRSDNLRFGLKNGVITGGDTRGLGSHGSIIGVISVNNSANTNLVTTVQDISHTSQGGFYKGKQSKVVFKGKVTLNNDQFNVRAKNMDFYGNPLNEEDPENTDFYGYTSANGEPNDWSQGNGGLNLSFDGYENFRGPGQRILNINKNAKVKLKNDNNTTSNSRAYANNIANFAVINLDGSLDTEAIGTTLRTTASRYDYGAGTASGQAEINIRPGSTFKTLSTAITNTNYGTIFTYSLDINVDNPKIFDIRFFGTGQFFYSWANRGGSNLNIKNSNIAVWDKSRKGIGNPNDIWQDVDWMMIRGFTNSGNPKAMSSNNDLANRFTINNYSRISNDIKLPIIIPDEEFQVGNTVVLKNNATSFYGSTDYYLPDGSLVGQAAPGAAVLFELAGRKYTTVTDSNGNWRFNNLDITSVSGGTYGQLSMIDQDKRISKIVPVLIEDKVPPTGDPRLIKAKKGDMTNLTDPKYAVLNSKDETTPTNQLIYEYVTSLEDRQKMVSEVGTYEVEVKLSDLAGNYTIIKAPVIVHEPPEVITDGFITGKDFEIDFDTWVSANDAGKRQLMISEEYGNLRGFEITGQNLIDITNIPSKLGINFSGHNWEPKKTYPITVKVKSYTKVIRVTLVPAEVEMNPNQVYSGTITPIYIDLTNNAKVDNSKIEKVKIGDDLETIVNQMITDKKMTLNYTGYGEVKVKDYKVIVNGNELKTSVVPDQNFQLVYNYTGQMKFASAPNLDFGKIETSQKQESYKLVSTSESDVSVINTLLNDNWNLQVSLPQGIKNKKTQEEFIGQLVYFDSAGKETVIDKYGKKIMEQKPEMMSLSKVDVRGSGKSGMTLKQEIGNSNGDYEGELIWSLEDSPKP